MQPMHILMSNGKNFIPKLNTSSLPKHYIFSLQHLFTLRTSTYNAYILQTRPHLPYAAGPSNPAHNLDNINTSSQHSSNLDSNFFNINRLLLGDKQSFNKLKQIATTITNRNSLTFILIVRYDQQIITLLL